MKECGLGPGAVVNARPALRPRTRPSWSRAGGRQCGDLVRITYTMLYSSHFCNMTRDWNTHNTLPPFHVVPIEAAHLNVHVLLAE